MNRRDQISIGMFTPILRANFLDASIKRCNNSLAARIINISNPLADNLQSPHTVINGSQRPGVGQSHLRRAKVLIFSPGLEWLVLSQRAYISVDHTDCWPLFSTHIRKFTAGNVLNTAPRWKGGKKTVARAGF